MSLSERLLKYAETIITLSQSLEETKEQIQERLSPPKEP